MTHRSKAYFLALSLILCAVIVIPRSVRAQMNGPGQSLTCSSDDGRRHYCSVNTFGGVRMTRQISGSPCVQGQTWGFDRQGVWVDRGCRAEFFAGGYGQGGGQTITCSSNDGRRNFCNADTRGGVQLSRQISGSPCIQGQTWGYNRNSVWVDRGCRAEFIVGVPQRPFNTVTCSSNDGRRNWCAVDPRANVRLSRQISGSPCVQGQTWGVDRRGLWVDRGCRAEFQVR